ncbi:MAG: mannose-6-phosphate isomerase, class I [Candidatus Omnitrophica bacterium]|nr:mannose-6-phosphate isomerase, class I [Candidatus Omnitrophota bacterium]MDD5487565.1 mannose-6-phosphate isomerase, class I [Candidatus Omnitrophota bacterium]
MQGAAAYFYLERNGENPIAGAVSRVEDRYEWDAHLDAREQARSGSPAVRSYIDRPVPLKIHCEVMDYAWGDPKFIPALIRVDNTEGKPYAELWIGAHPKAPARANVHEIETNLYELIGGAADEILGEEAARIFHSRLPYLFKVLTASTALSIQAHPNKQQAEEGWARENGQGPNYKDDNHKPEIICAVTRFWALNGFRPAGDIMDDFEALGVPALSVDLGRFKTAVRDAGSNEDAVRAALRDFYSAIMGKVAALKKAEAGDNVEAAADAQGEIADVVRHVVGVSRTRLSHELGTRVVDDIDTIFAAAREQGKEIDLRRELWTLRLNDLYPDDMGVLSTYLLNLVRLEPGEAMYLSAGELHAYLGKLDPASEDEGMGMELMANSDNVLRGGLTPKHVDVPELLKTLTFNSGEPRILTPRERARAERVYETPAPEFELSVIDVNMERIFSSRLEHSADALIVLDGRVEVHDANGFMLIAEQGETFLMPASSGRYTIRPVTNTAKLYKASIPQSTITEAGDKRGTEEKALSVEDKRAVWTAVDNVTSDKLRVVLPQSVVLTGDVKKTIAAAQQKHDGKIEVVRVRAEDLVAELASGEKGVKRIIVADTELAAAVDSLVNTDENAALLRDVRLVRMNMPSTFISDDYKTTYQSRMLMIALIARVIDEGQQDSRTLKDLLGRLLEGTFTGVDIDVEDFVNALAVTEDENTPIQAVRERVGYFLSEIRAISLVNELVRDFSMIREFWIYA